MSGSNSGSRHWLTGLSARLLVLTVFFVMLSEVLIYAPSIARYRVVYFEQRIAAAHLASLALDAPPGNAITPQVRRQLLDHARSYGVVLRRPDSKALILSSDMPPGVAATYDLRNSEFFSLIWESFMVLGREGPRYIRIIAPSPKAPDNLVETVIDEAPLRAEMYQFSGRILALSIVISLLTACLVYLSLHLLFVRPMQRVTESMIAFRHRPEDTTRTMMPGTRRDEIGQAERELADMQENLRAALRQRRRLAELGTAVTKVNHDLRNILATAQLLSDRVGLSRDPDVRRVAPSLLAAVDRAVNLCTDTLRFVHDDSALPEFRRFGLADLLLEVEAEVVRPRGTEVNLETEIPDGLQIVADRGQIFRVLSNLVLNAAQAGAGRVTISAAAGEETIRIEVADNGPGLPAAVLEHLFQPFTGAGRSGGTGLGLSIARDLMRAQGGEIELLNTGPGGTVFSLCLPLLSVEEFGGEAPRRRAAQAR